MPAMSAEPILFLAFANDRQASGAYLRNLGQEAEQLRDALAPAEQAGLCQVEVLTSASAESILKRFHDPAHKGRIALLHYAGHAEDYDLLLESASGAQAIADGRGLAAFLRQQSGLHLVFLNACSTRAQVEGLLDAGIAAVIATARAVDDQVATDFARHFYTALAGGDNIRTSFEKAQAALHFVRGDLTRHLRPTTDPHAEHASAGWPWKLYLRQGAEESGAWNLPAAANDPLFGLPPLPAMDLPAKPFRDLSWFRRADAPIFFGRGQQIRQLYTTVTADQTAPIVLFYGQSGVGKSSLLDAGLLPRLEQVHQVVYMRRDQKKGLLGTLLDHFPGSSTSSQGAAHFESAAHLDTWRAVEQQAGKPLTLILDQVEEHFTRPNPELPDELTHFLTALVAILADRSQRPQGKLILSFRKEWLAEIEKRLIECELPFRKVFLERLDEAGVIEAVRGVATTSALHQHYGLTIDDGLAEEIAHDLLQDREAAVAPMLQILLTRLWEEATQHNRAQPRFDQTLYDQLRREGLKLEEFLDQQLARLKAQMQEAVDSGLALDLLSFHTTRRGTAEQHEFAKLQAEYRHRANLLTDLVLSLQNLYLLVDPAADQENPARPTRLAHDTLASLVRARFDESDAPGQRARRILEARAVDWVNDKEGAPLDETDLALVEAGQSGMRVWRPVEKRLLRASRIARGRLQRERDETRARELAQQRELEQAYTRVKEQLSISESQRLAFVARSLQATAPETALLLACEAVHWHHNPLSEEALRDVLDAVSWQVTALAGHGKEVNSAVFSRDGLQILTASDDGTARLWNADGQASIVFRGHTNSVTSAIFSPDETQILTVSKDGTARLWRLNGQPIGVCTAYSESGIFSPDGQYVLVRNNSKVWLWQATDELCQTYSDGGSELQPILERIGRAESAEAKTELWIQYEQLKHTGHSGSIYSAVFSPDGQRIVTASADYTARIWDLSGRQLTILRGHTDQVVNAIFKPPDGQIILTGSHDKTARLWRDNGELLATLEHEGDVYYLAFSPDGQKLLTAVGDSRSRAVVRLWDSSGQLLATLKGHNADDLITWTGFSQDGQHIITTASDNTARLWDLKGQTLAVFQGYRDRIKNATVNPDGQLITVTALPDGTTRVWKPVESPLPIIKDHEGAVDQAVYSADGMHILTTSLSMTHLWTTAGQLRASYRGRADLFTDEIFSSDGQYLLTIAGKTNRVCVWQLPLGLQWVRRPDQRGANESPVEQETQSDKWIEPARPIVTFMVPERSTRLRKAVFSPDAQRILTLADEVAHLWDQQGNLIVSLKGPILPTVDWELRKGEPTPPDVHFAMFSPDKQHVLTASQNGIVWLWSMGGELITSFLPTGYASKNDNVFSVTFSPNGQRILTTVRGQADLWNLRGRHLATLPCSAYKLWNGWFSPDSQRVVTVGTPTYPDVRLWSGDGRLITELEIAPHFSDLILFDRASQYLCITDGNRLKLWDRNGSLLTTLTIAPRTAIRRVAFSPTSEYLLTASSDGTAQLWDIRAGGTLQTTFKGHTEEVNSAVFSPDGRRVLTASSDGTVRQFLVEIDDLLATATRRVGRSLDAEEIARFNVPTPLRFKYQPLA